MKFVIYYDYEYLMVGHLIIITIIVIIKGNFIN